MNVSNGATMLFRATSFRVAHSIDLLAWPGSIHAVAIEAAPEAAPTDGPP